MDKSTRQRIERIRKLVAYALERAPDEFGLVADEEGFVSLKELRQGLSEEEGWGFLRISHFHEMLLHDRGERFEVQGERIRARNAGAFGEGFQAIHPPKILYFGVRPRAWPHVAERGLNPYRGKWVILARTPDMALRMGKRRHARPILLEIHAGRAQTQGVSFFARGTELVFTPHVPPRFISGPPVAPPETEAKPRPQKTVPEPAGGFWVDPVRDLGFPVPREEKGRKRKDRRDRSRRERRQARDLKKRGGG